MSGDHSGDGHGHDHGEHELLGDRAWGPTKSSEYYGKRIYAIRELLIEKGVLTDDDIKYQIALMETKTPANGAKLVARAWVDPDFKQRLTRDPKAACAEMGIDATSLNEFVVLENTDSVRHMTVCTLCSCYPRPILGRPPDWYKSFNYRQRAVIDPRGVMREFGLEVPPEVEVRVHDSTSDIRYLVLPQRPKGTEGWSVEQLEQLVTRDSLIGVQDPLQELPRGEAVGAGR
jgi:nitrile hydratase